jgi:hypothetical protein
MNDNTEKPCKQAAFELIHEYYYSLPNNGMLDHGINSCESRYNEAINCALIGVKRIILVLEFISIESNDPAVMKRINLYDKVEEELNRILSGESKMTFEEFIGWQS